MKAQWLQLSTRFAALQLRERWLIGLTILGGILLIGSSLFIEPALQRAQQAERRMTEHRQQLAALQAQTAEMQSPAQDPDVAARIELDALKKQVSMLASRMEAMESALVPPQRMSGLLEDMIGAQTGLRLLSLKTLPVTPLMDNKAGAVERNAAKPSGDSLTASAGLFRHGVEIRLEGSYQDLAAYLERLENARSKVLWSAVSLSAEKHPRLVLTLTVFTLSLDRAWLIV